MYHRISTGTGLGRGVVSSLWLVPVDLSIDDSAKIIVAFLNGKKSVLCLLFG